eukprot:10110087-Heterocapsa_arctica.AAC.1
MENPRAARRNWRNAGANLAEWKTHRERKGPGKRRRRAGARVEEQAFLWLPTGTALRHLGPQEPQ